MTFRKQEVRFAVTPCFTHYTHVSLAGFLRRMLGLGEETSVGAPPTPPPWVWACTMVAPGWVVLKVLLMGLATKPSAKTTPECNKSLVTNKSQLRTYRHRPFSINWKTTRLRFRLRLLLLLLSDDRRLLYSLCGD